VVLFAAVGAFVVMETALFAHDFSSVRRRQRRARDARPLHVHRRVVGARGLDPVVVTRALDLRGVHDVALPQARDDPIVAWATLVQLVVLLLLLRVDALRGKPVQGVHGAIPLDGAARNRCCRTIRSSRSIRRCSTRATSGSRSRSRSRSPRSSPAASAKGWLADVRRTTLVAWGFLTVGIVLGAWWSYEVLGLGRLLGLGPVENASLLPWLTRPRSSTR
jgi:cytochrome c-type biogenesis protein CcmF